MNKQKILKKIKQIEDEYSVSIILIITLIILFLSIILAVLLGWGFIHIIREQIIH